jgi:acetyltransferase-like isoleucine patch superfamily enzyme
MNLTSFLLKVFKKLNVYGFLELVEGQYYIHKVDRLKRDCKSVGGNLRLNKDFFIVNPQYISFGHNCSSLHNLRLEAWDKYGEQVFRPEILIGDNVIFNSDCHIGCIDKVQIGDNVLIASRVYISDHSHGEITAEALKLIPKDRPLVSKGPVIIEDNVWIGEGVSIMPGVTVGKNSIIGTNSVVTKDVPANSVVAGIPARVLKCLD